MRSNPFHQNCFRRNILELPLGLLIATGLYFAGACGTPSESTTSTATSSTEAHADHDHPPGEDHADHDHDHDDHDHDSHDHDSHDHDETTSITLSPQALKNIAYEPATVALGAYVRTISLPGMIVERHGRTQIQVSAPLTGIVTRIYVIEGEAIEPHSPLFDIRLTHEELVASQSEFLRLAEALDVVNREIERLQSITEGVIAGRRIVEQEYERQKLEGQLRAGRQALLLHGLSDAQIDEILKSRELLKSLTIRAPDHEDYPDCAADHLFHLQQLDVHVGQQVEAGQSLGVLADHCQLYIEGTAFEQDSQILSAAARSGASVSADLLLADKRQHAVDDLKILYLSDQVDRDSRALHFYLPLSNEIVADRTENNHRFLEWRFKPGQRVELRVPVEEWQDRIVVPAESVVTEGAESYVYQQEGDHFHRTPVHVEHRDKRNVVLAADDAIQPGDIIAAQGAFQIHLALKNKSGAPIDPHAGHSH